MTLLSGRTSSNLGARSELAVRRIDSPLGGLIVTASERGLRGVGFSDDGERGIAGACGGAAGSMLDRACNELAGYFAGDLVCFSVPLDLRGTAFQLEVWRALCGVGFGATTSYGAVARTIGRPSAVRAVGAAVGRNPASVVVPCHRVLGAGGALTGYAWGLDRKRRLLAHETHAGGGC